MSVACDHKVADHVCGTYARYALDGCRCGDCRQARKVYEKNRRRWTGEFPTAPEPYVDADQARKLIAELKDRGMGLKTIAATSDVAHGTLWKLVYGKPGRGPSKRCRPDTVDKLAQLLDGLVWEEVTLADGARVDGREAKLIVKELVARGWAKAEIGRRVHGPQARSLQAARFKQVTVSTLRILRELMCEPVPMRVHSPTGKFYQPKKDRPPRAVPRLVDGVGGPIYREPISGDQRILDLLEIEGWMTYQAIAHRLDLSPKSMSNYVGRLGDAVEKRTVDGVTEVKLAKDRP